MAIKLYKSQLEPTSKTSNVLDTRQISLSEAGSIGKAMKGMLKSGENFYIQHQKIKSDDELLDKKKQVMLGDDKNKGMEAVKLEASNMKDPDEATKYYAENVKVFEDVGETKGLFTKKKYNNWFKKQTTEDLTTIKKLSTKNFMEKVRTNELDYLEVLKKKILYAKTEEERKNAESELAERINTKSTEIFGDGIDAVKKSVQKDIAFYGYKNVPFNQQAKALADAEKDKRLTIEDVEKLRKHFKVSKGKATEGVKAQLKTYEENADKGIVPDANELSNIVAVAAATGDTKLIARVDKFVKGVNLYGTLNTMDFEELTKAKSSVSRILTQNNRSGKGTDADTQMRADIINKYYAKLVSDIDKDMISAAGDRNLVQISDLGLNEFLSTGNVKQMAKKVSKRITDGNTIAAFYRRDVEYLTKSEVSQIKSIFERADTPGEIINITTALTTAFGNNSDKVFKQLGKDNALLAHLGGLNMMTNVNGTPNEAVSRIVDGYLLLKNSETAQLYKVSETNNMYQQVKNEAINSFVGKETYNRVIMAADAIYASMSKEKGKTGKQFDKGDYKKAMAMAVGADGKFGGFDSQDRGEDVIIPPWLKNGKFENVQDMLEEDRSLLVKAGNGNPIDVNGKDIDIFATRKPIFMSVGNGKYMIAIGDSTTKLGTEPKYVLSDDGKGFFIIDLNKIKGEVLGAL
jgi:hypothetical protein